MPLTYNEVSPSNPSCVITHNQMVVMNVTFELRGVNCITNMQLDYYCY